MILKAILTHSQAKKKNTLCNLFNIQLEKKLQNSYSHHFLSFQAPKKKKKLSSDY